MRATTIQAAHRAILYSIASVGRRRDYAVSCRVPVRSTPGAGSRGHCPIAPLIGRPTCRRRLGVCDDLPQAHRPAPRGRPESTPHRRRRLRPRAESETPLVWPAVMVTPSIGVLTSLPSIPCHPGPRLNGKLAPRRVAASSMNAHLLQLVVAPGRLRSRSRFRSPTAGTPRKPAVASIVKSTATSSLLHAQRMQTISARHARALARIRRRRNVAQFRGGPEVPLAARALQLLRHHRGSVLALDRVSVQGAFLLIAGIASCKSSISPRVSRGKAGTFRPRHGWPFPQ